MLKLNTTPITDAAQFPIKKGTLRFLQEAYQGNDINILAALRQPNTINPSVVSVLWGCENTGTGSNYIIGAGAVVYLNEIFVFDGATFTVTSGVPVATIAVTQDTTNADPVTFTDGVARNVHDIRKLSIAEATSGSGIANYSAFVFDAFYPRMIVDTSSRKRLATKVVEIGDWDMDTNATKTVAHGLGSNWNKIRSFSAIIRTDDDTLVFKLDSINTSGVVLGGSAEIDATNITLVRTPGALFDGSDYNSVTFNRGWITIQYEI
jgi:hypothetical protein